MSQIQEIPKKPDISYLRLRSSAVEALTDDGWKPEDWIDCRYGKPSPAGRVWLGDSCGCPDDRCIGFHHGKSDDCGCLTSLLDDPAFLADTCAAPGSHEHGVAA